MCVRMWAMCAMAEHVSQYARCKFAERYNLRVPY